MFNNHHNVTDTKLHYRMYKSGKQWVYQAIAVGIIAAAGSYAVMSATHVVSHADSISTSQQSNVTSGTWGTSNWSIQSNNGTQQLVINAGQIDTKNFTSDITSAIRSVNGNVSMKGTVTDKDGNNVSTIGLNGNVPVVTDSADHVFYGAGTLANAVSNNDKNATVVTLTDKVSAPADSSGLFGPKNWYDKSTITTINGLSNLDTSNVTKMDNMFNSSVLHFTDSDKSAIENLDMSKTTSAYNVFSTQALDSFDTLNLSNWNLSKLNPWGNAITPYAPLTHLKSIKLNPNNNGNFFWINLQFQSKTSLAGSGQSSDTVFYNPNIPNNVPLIDIGDSGQTNGTPWSLSGSKDNPVITMSNVDLTYSTQFKNNLSNVTPVMNFIKANPNTQIVLKNVTGGDLTNIKLLDNNGALFMVQYSDTTAYVQSLGQGGTLPSNVQLSNILPSTITDIDVGQDITLSQQSDNLFANMPNLQSVNIEGTFDNSKSVSANNLFANDPNLKFVSLDALLSASNLTANNIFDGDNNIQYIPSLLNQYIASLSSYKNTITFGNSNIGKNFVFNTSFGNSQLRTTDGTSNSLITLMLKNYPSGIVILPDTATYKSSINMSLPNTNNNYNNNLATQVQSYISRQIFPNNGNSPLVVSNATSAIQNSSGQMVSWPVATTTDTTTTYNGSTVTNGNVNISNINPGTDGLLWYAMGTDNKLHVYFTDKVVSSNLLPVNNLYSVNNNIVQFKDNAVINVKELLSDKTLEGAVISSQQAYSPVNMTTDTGEKVVGIGYVNNQMFIATDNTIYVGGGPNMSGSQGWAITNAIKDNVNTSYVSSRYTLNYILPTISSYGGENAFSGISNMVNTQNVVLADTNNTSLNSTPGLYYNSAGSSNWTPQTNSPITNLTYLNLTGLKISSLRNNPNSVIGQQGFASMPNLNKLTLSDQSVLGPDAQSISLYNGKWTNGKETLTGDQLADGIAHPGDWVSDQNSDFDKLNSFVIDKLNAVNAQKSQDDKDKDTALATQKAESDKAQQDAIAKQQAEDAQHLDDEIAAYQAKAAKEKTDALTQLQAQADQDKATALANQQAQSNTDKNNAVSQQKQTDDADKAQALSKQKAESDEAKQDALNAQKAQFNKEKADALAAQKAQDDQDKTNALAQAQNDKNNAVNQLKEYYENLLNSTKGSQDKTVSDLRNELKNTSSQYEQALRDKDTQHATELANVMKDNAIKIKDAVEAQKASDDANKTQALSAQKAQSDKELSDYKNAHKQVNKKHIKAHYVKISQHGKNFKKYVKLLRKAHVRGRQLQTPTMQVLKSTKLSNGKLKLTVRIDGHKLTFTEFSKGDVHSAYYQKADLGKRKHIKIKVLRPIHMHIRLQFTPENYTHVLKKGTKLTVKGITETNGITRFVLSNSERITANKYFVSVIK